MKKITIYIVLILSGFGCKKLTQVPEPVNTITTTEVFKTDANATSAVVGIYYDLLNGQTADDGYTYGGGLGSGFSCGGATLVGGLSADELLGFGHPTSYETNTLNSSNASQLMWKSPYFAIYGCNSAINNLLNASKLTPSLTTQLLGEAKFLRALSYFYLVNFFGVQYTTNPNGLGVPFVTTITYAVNDTLSRASTAKIYQLMISDLADAQNELKPDYSVSGGDRIRANQASALALLSRIYLFMGDYKNAYIASNSVLSNSLYNLQSDLNQVFLVNSSEAILQLQTANKYPFATSEAVNFLPYDHSSSPNYILTDQLLNSFESGDKRKAAWVDTTNYSGQRYYYPNKYKVYQSSGTITENYMVLRLAEQYLIRAEAQANGEGNGLPGAISDLNVIRTRAGLPGLSSSLTKDKVIAAVMQERKIELFAEWGHRWLDLKRTGQAQTVLSTDKGFAVPANQLLYPIPASELINDNHLVQNPGY